MIYGPLEGCSAYDTALLPSRLNSLGAEPHTENMDLAIGRQPLQVCRCPEGPLSGIRILRHGNWMGNVSWHRWIIRNLTPPLRAKNHASVSREPIHIEVSVPFIAGSLVLHNGLLGAWPL